ncbi:MAG: hypothetical protein MJ114_05975 [Acetatifactor sp.]|nr:hypothetical protein [Acetatifactor sp.]
MKNYMKPMVVANDELAEGVYLASGDCWTVSCRKDQNDAGGYCTFRIQCNHNTNQQHISKATTVTLVFDQPITGAEYEGFQVSVSGNVVTCYREQLGDSYLSGDNFNSLVKIWCDGFETVQCTNASIVCTKTVNVQGNGADGN